MLVEVKKQLGGACTYLSFSKEKIKDENGEWVVKDAFKAIMLNDNGGKDTVVFTINKPIHTLKGEDFQRLFFRLNSRDYEQRSGDSV